MTDQFIKPVKAKKTPAKKTTAKKYKSARILFVLDRSGSMASVRDDTIGGFNAFVEEQKNFKQKATLTLCQFDHKHEHTYHNTPLEEVKPLDRYTYLPRGSTALYDAIGQTITDALAADHASPTGRAPKTQKTILAILTDGEENASREFRHEAVKKLVEQVQAENDWEVIFIGANIDAAHVGGSMGVMASKTASFDYTGKGITDVMKTVAYASNASRGMDYDWMKTARAHGTMLEGAAGLDIGTLYNTVSMGVDEKFKKMVKPDIELKAKK